MAVRIAFKVSSEEAGIIDNFCRQVGMDRNSVAKKSLFMIMNQAYDKAARLQKEIEENASKSTDAGGDMGSVSVDSEVSNSDVSTESKEV